MLRLGWKLLKVYISFPTGEFFEFLVSYVSAAIPYSLQLSDYRKLNL